MCKIGYAAVDQQKERHGDREVSIVNARPSIDSSHHDNEHHFHERLWKITVLDFVGYAGIRAAWASAA